MKRVPVNQVNFNYNSMSNMNLFVSSSSLSLSSISNIFLSLSMSIFVFVSLVQKCICTRVSVCVVVCLFVCFLIGWYENLQAEIHIRSSAPLIVDLFTMENKSG